MQDIQILKLMGNFEHKVPSDITLHTTNVKDLYKSCIKLFKKMDNNCYLWMSIDEATDAAGRYVAYTIIGILDPDEVVAKQNFLLNTAELDM